MIGMYVCALDKPWSESSFLFQGFSIQNQQILQQLKSECEYVYIDIVKQKSAFPVQYTKQVFNNDKKSKAQKRPASLRQIIRKLNRPAREHAFNKLQDIIDRKIDIDNIEPPKKLKSFEQEISHAQKVHVRACQAIKKFLQDAGTGKPIDSHVATGAVYECMRSILRSPDAMMLMTHLRHKDEYTWHHSMNVCVLAISFGRHLNLRYEELITLGLCGMLHDIGKMRIPSDLLKKPEVSHPGERELLRAHTVFGYNILLSTSGISKVVAEVARNHHERLDGKGFPRGLTKDQISPFTRMISIVDKYDSITTDRPHRQGKTHLEAINALIDASATEIDERLVSRFIQCIGIYPAGSIIETHNGEIGIVIEVNQQKKLRPKIVLILNKEKKFQSKRVIDLAGPLYDTPDNPYTIRTIIRPDKYAIDVSKYYNYGVIQKGLVAA